MPQTKKKATAKAVKTKTSGAKKAPASITAGRNVTRTATNKAAAGKKASDKSATTKKSLSSKTSPTPKSTAAGKKMLPTKSAGKMPVTKPAVIKKPNSQAKAKKDNPVQSLAKLQKAASAKEGKTIDKSKRGKIVSESVMAESKATVSDSRAGANKLPVKAKSKKQNSGLSDSISQGLGKQAPKKRGWRDIEALTERARLKSLLSDIWHEDIDLDSDIFGETDHLSGYYTDKEEEIEVEAEEDEEWEEFEEDED